MDLTEIKGLLVAQGDQFKSWTDSPNERIETMQSDFDKFVLKSQRPGATGTTRTEGYTAKLGEALRKAALGNDAEIKAMSASSDPDGGYMVIPALDNQVRLVRDQISPLSGLVRNVDLSTGGELLMPYAKGTLPSGWTGEMESRTTTDTVGMGEHRVALHEVYCCPQVSQKLLDTANYDVGAILVDQITHGLAAAEAEALHTGNGVMRPRGFTTITTSTDPDSTRTFDKAQHIVTGTNGTLGSTPTDKLLEAVGALKPQYRANAKWLMSRATASMLWKLKVGANDDRPLWQQSLIAGQPDILLGYEVVISDNVPDPATGSLSIWFGDWEQGYTTARQPGIKLLRDPYTTKGQVSFFAYQRVGGMVSNCEAIKALKFST